jgi:hypothetical protein
LARLQVSDFDREYIDELLRDLMDRARERPEEVFQQLSSLSSGPLITDSVEWKEVGDLLGDGLY